MPKTSSDALLARRWAQSQPFRRLKLNGATMATRWSVLCDAGSAIDAAALHADLAAAVDRVDAQMSPWKPTSDLVRMNHALPGEWVDLPPEIMRVLARALGVARLSGGAFDPTVGALVDAWGFGAARDSPDAAAIRAGGNTEGRAGHAYLELDSAHGRARKHAPLQIDLCAIAKGHAVDQMVAALQRHGVAHALAALDGELRALGAQVDGSPWAVALESPDPDRRAVHGVVELQDLALATSGDYRHYIRVGGHRIAHTMDPRRAAPVRNDVASVTVLAPAAIDADAWATALLVAGPGEGLSLAHRMGLEALFLLRRGSALVEMGTGRFGTGG